MRKVFYFYFFFFIISWQLVFSQENYTQYVNPFIGTGGHGHTFPGAVLPFGMVQLSPDTRVDGSWDGCGGYHYSDSIIYGFSHTHLSGTGVSDWGDILIMPTSQVPSMDQKIYASKFSHKKEKASPGYYEVTLTKDNIKAELTATLRSGIHRYSFSQGKKQTLILDLLHRDRTLDCDLRQLDSVTFSGYRVSEAWAREQHVYFVIKFSKPVKKINYAFKKQLKASLNKSLGEKASGASFEFTATDNKPIMVKVGISSVSEDGAIKNILAEAPHWDFERFKADAERAWNKQLKKVEVKDSDRNKISVFYTALYHCFIHPSLNMDVDMRYRGRDNKIHEAEGFVNYSVFSLWDTYRALNPLFTILQPGRVNDFINTFLVQYKQAGRLPVWELSGNETDCMIGFHSVSVIADAMTKGIKGFDTLVAYEAMKAASNYTGYGIPIFNKNGFLQVDDESESVSKTLEYGYDNWCIAKVAQLIGKKDDEPVYFKRAQAFRNLFDDSTGFMRPRKNGNWLNPFYASEINNHFTEGNSWQYSFYVPHDISALIKLHGGKINFEKKLDELFTTTEKTRGRDQADVTGLVGQYAHGNEPSHHMAYLYNYVGQPLKTIARVNQICRDFYKNSPDGLIGNEDCGQMSAWYIFSAMGMYPVCPGSGEYILSAPLFSAVKINLENGKTFSINYNPLPSDNVLGISLNDKIHPRSAIDHSMIADGGTMNYLFSSPANNADRYGEGVNSILSKRNKYPVLIPSPLIKAPGQVFKDKMPVAITPLNKEMIECTFTTDGSEPTRFSNKYSGPFVIETNTTVKARAYPEIIPIAIGTGRVTTNDSSAVTTATFYKIKYDFDVQLHSLPNPQYAAEGAQSLIDGIGASIDWRKGNWLGFQGQNFECVVDLNKLKDIGRMSLNALQDTRSWIVFPTEVSFYGSLDNQKYELLQIVTCHIKAEDTRSQIFKFETTLPAKRTFRYIKIKARNFGKLPEWHQGSGGEAFIFVDEMEVE